MDGKSPATTSRIDGLSRVALQVDGVWKRFGNTQALADVSMQLNTGTVHGLVGRNGAGKSTLVSTIVGELKPDRGRVILPGDDGSLQDRVAVVHQQLKLVPHLSVAENLQLGVYKRRWVRWSELRRQAKDVLEEWELPVLLDEPIGGLRLDQQQMITVARALMSGRRLVLLDEPTSRLNWHEAEELIGHVKRLTTRGITFLFISHSLHEVLDLCDDVTVLRDGRVVATGAAASFDEADLISKMTSVDGASSADSPGSAPQNTPVHEQVRPARSAGDTETVVVRARAVQTKTLIRGVDLEAREGEWLGLTGLVGSGAVTLANLIAGYGSYSSGSIEIGGRRLPSGRSDLAVKLGVGFVPPDRHLNGVVPTLSVKHNLTLASLPELARFGFVREDAERRMAQSHATQFDIVSDGLDASITSLSGGNQQKVLLGRAFASKPIVLVLTNPTVGVDVASKRVIYQWMDWARDQGFCGIVASEDELTDLGACDRVLVMHEGRIVTELGADRTPRDVLQAIEHVAVGTKEPSPASRTGGA